MYLYHLSVQRGGGITTAVSGSFTAAKQTEVVLVSGSRVELVQFTDTGLQRSLDVTDTFGVVRDVATVRQMGGSHDYLVISSDSGRIVIAEWVKGAWTKVQEETYGRTGCRRVIPGQFLAADLHGRAVMIAAVEKQKLVYSLNREASTLTIASPLEAHKANTILSDVVPVDVGFENPLFACIEMDHEEADADTTGKAAESAQKALTYYKLDLGLNHVVRAWTTPIERSANKLVGVPGEPIGPSGVLVCSEDLVTYVHEGAKPVSVAIPRRANIGDASRTTLITSHAVLRKKNFFMIFLQSEYGDIFRVKLGTSADNKTVKSLALVYLDTVAPATAMCILPAQALLFVAAEAGNHCVYKINGTGEDAEETGAEFIPHPLENLLLQHETDSLAPVLDHQISDLYDESSPQMYALTGRGNRSALRIMRHGLPVTTLLATEIPGKPQSVWTVRATSAQTTDSYIVISFVDATLVLSIGEVVEESNDSGLLSSTRTLDVSLLGDNSMVQVHPKGVRHVKAGGVANEWEPPSGRPIVKAACNSAQVAVALQGGEIVYFELDAAGTLVEVKKRELGNEVSCLDIAPVADGRARASLLAVGMYDKTVRIFSLDSETCLDPFGMQSTDPAVPVSACLMHVAGVAGEKGLSTVLSIGLDNGTLQRLVVSDVDGKMVGLRARYLGPKAVRLRRVLVRGEYAMMANSAQPWLAYTYQGKHQMTRLSYDMVEDCFSFSSEQFPEAIVCAAGTEMRIIALEQLGESFNQERIPLRYTPRRLLIHAASKLIVTIESDHGAYSAAEKAQLYAEGNADEYVNADGLASSATAGPHLPMRLATPGLELDEDEQVSIGGEGISVERSLGAPHAASGKWASCIRLYDPAQRSTVHLIELDEGESAVSLAPVVFHDRDGETFVVVGTACNMSLYPRGSTGGFLYVFRVTTKGGTQLFCMHKTPVPEGVPQALHAFQGRVLVGVGNTLRLYDLGKKKLLRKSERKGFPTLIRDIRAQGDRIVVSDVAESVHFVKYKKSDNLLGVFADDVAPRWMTSAVLVDYDTVCGADKFGNVFVLRLPGELPDDEIDQTISNAGDGVWWDRGYLNGAPTKLELLAHFHAGELVTSMRKASFLPNTDSRRDAVVFCTVNGGIGALLPFESRTDVDFFAHLELHLRSKYPTLSGREHMSYRSYFAPVKNVIDGDLCEQFHRLPADVQNEIAEELECTAADVIKRIDDIRALIV